jgi:hypothetical protein
MKTKYGYIEFTDFSQGSGFYSNYFSVLSTIQDCTTKKLKPYVDASNTWFNPTYNVKDNTVSDLSINPWDWWFIQNKKEDITSSVKVGINRQHINHRPDFFVFSKSKSRFKALAKEFCAIKSYILEEEELLYKQYIENKNTLGILARGTEMLIHHPEYPKVITSSWPEIIKLCLSQNPDIDNIFLVSEDKEILKSIVNAYPETKYLEHFFRSTTQTRAELSHKGAPWWLSSPNGNPNHRKRLGEESLIQIRLLSRCNYFLGSHSGMFNAVNFFNEIPFKEIYLI